jgi:hypothetical protein
MLLLVVVALQPWQVSGEFLPNRLIAPWYKNLCAHWPMDEVCVAAISFVSFGERLAKASS